jgi:RNA polymerase sigma factor (sigma-70 family)
MPYQDADLLMRYVRRLAATRTDIAPSDSVLLERVLHQNDGAALELVMRRHGPMILGVCRRILGERHLVEDAFQATFLVLLRRGSTIRARESLAGWLYRIAFRIALRARGQCLKIDSRAIATARANGPEPLMALCQRELCSIVDEEINRLPERCRVPTLLCYLEGLTRDEAAQNLQLPLRTLQRRLEEGRSLLRTRLARRGLTLSAAGMAGALAESSSGAASFANLLSRSQPLLLAQVSAAAQSNAALSSGVITLATGLTRRMAISRVTSSLGLGLGALALTFGLGLLWADVIPATTADVENPEPPKVAQGTNAAKSFNPLQVGEKTPASGVIKGVVLDEQEKPVPAAKVYLNLYVDHKPVLRQAAVDAQGRFQFDQVPRGGNKILDVFAYADGTSFGGSLLTLAERQPPIQCTVRLAASRQLKLRIVDRNGVPVQGVELAQLQWWSERGLAYLVPDIVWDRETLAPSATGPDGILIIDRIPRGAKGVQGVLKHAEFALERFQENQDLGKTTEVKLTPGIHTRFRLVNGISKQPVVGGAIGINWHQAGIESFNNYYRPADSNGHFSVCLAPDRDYSVGATHSKFASSRRHSSLRVTKDACDHALELVPKARVTGVCLDAQTGLPIAHASVFARPSGSAEPVGSGNTGDGGTYEFDACVGSVRISAQASGYLPKQSDFIDVKEKSLNLAPDLKLDPLPAIEGVVTSPDGTPARNIAVLGLNSGSAQDVSTNAAGEFLLPWKSFQGDGGVVVRHPYEKLSGFASIQPLNAQRKLQIQLLPEGTVRGSLVDTNGQPRPGQPVWLRISDMGGSLFSPVLCDIQGKYQFTGLPRMASYAVLGNDRDFRLASEWFKLDDESVTVPPLRNDGVHPRMVSTHPANAQEFRCRAWLNSPPISVESLRGKIVLLYTWAYWRSVPPGFLEQIHRRYSTHGVVVIAIHQQGGVLEEIKADVKRAGISFPVALDNDAGDTFKRYGIDYPESKILINRQGRIVAGDRFLETYLMDRVRHEVLYGEK